MQECIFCEIVNGSAHSWKVHETELAYAFLDINPVNPYHTLVIPKKHATNLFDVAEEDLLGVMLALKEVVDLYKKKLGLNQAQVFCSSGKDAQQDVFHLHFHLVPRHNGDGQNVRWKTHPALREQFETMLEKLK